MFIAPSQLLRQQLHNLVGACDPLKFEQPNAEDVYLYLPPAHKLPHFSKDLRLGEPQQAGQIEVVAGSQPEFEPLSNKCAAGGQSFHHRPISVTIEGETAAFMTQVTPASMTWYPQQTLSKHTEEGSCSLDRAIGGDDLGNWERPMTGCVRMTVAGGRD